MADQHDLAALNGIAAALGMDLRHQGTGGVEHGEVPCGGQLLDALGDPVGAEHRHAAGWDLVQLIDEHGAAGP